MLPFLDASIQNVTLKDANWLMAIGLFQEFLAIFLFTFAVKHLRTVEYGTVSYVEPLIASLIGVFLYSESLTLFQLAGCLIVLSGGMVQVVTSKINQGRHY
jgi:drug/metabolite transporter (DMT)-like permease